MNVKRLVPVQVFHTNFLPSTELSEGEDYVINQEATPADARALKEYLEHQGANSKLAMLNRKRFLKSGHHAESDSANSVQSDLHSLVAAQLYFFIRIPILRYLMWLTNLIPFFTGCGQKIAHWK